jgi:hypothetical protein
MLDKKIRRYKMMDIHRELIRTGKMQEARKILSLLKNGKVDLWLSDTDWNVEVICEELDCRMRYRSNGNSARAYL